MKDSLSERVTSATEKPSGVTSATDKPSGVASTALTGTDPADEVAVLNSRGVTLVFSVNVLASIPAVMVMLTLY